MDEARQQALWEHELARVYNHAIQKVAWEVHDRMKHELYDDEDMMHPTAEFILSMEIPYYPDEVEEMFERRNILLYKENLTTDEEEELQDLREQIEELPTGHSVQEQIAIDSITDAARLLRKHKVIDDGKDN